jgi:anti-anti-sigma factor
MALTAEGTQPARVVENSTGREVTVSGWLNVDSVAEVRLALHGVLYRGAGDLLIHLAQAEIQDATGLGVIVGIHHRARRLGRRLVLVDVSPSLDRLLQASRLDGVLARGPGRGVLPGLPSPASPAPSTAKTTLWIATAGPRS